MIVDFCFCIICNGMFGVEWVGWCREEEVVLLWVCGVGGWLGWY